MTPDLVQVQTTLGGEAAARRLAAALVGEHLAACVQVLGPVQSSYRWQGAVTEEAEWLCLVKTTAAALPHLLPRLRALHPYDTPEIIVLPILGGDADYLRWVAENVRSDDTT